MSDYAPRSANAFFQLSGPDAERYLNGQVSNDVRLANLETSIPACVTDLKGKLQALITIHRVAPETFVIEAQCEDSEELFMRLDRYLIADDAEWSDLRESYLTVEIFDNLDSVHLRKLPDGSKILIGPNEEIAPLLNTPVDLDQREQQRIENGHAIWEKEITPGILPPEAGLDETHIAYNKGCYIGQEVISRIKSIGRVNRHLVRLEILPPTPQIVGKKLLNSEGKAIGEITSLTSDGQRAIAYRHRKAEADSSFAIEDSSAIAQVVAS